MSITLTPTVPTEEFVERPYVLSRGPSQRGSMRGHESPVRSHTMLASKEAARLDSRGEFELEGGGDSPSMSSRVRVEAVNALGRTGNFAFAALIRPCRCSTLDVSQVPINEAIASIGSSRSAPLCASSVEAKQKQRARLRAIVAIKKKMLLVTTPASRLGLHLEDPCRGVPNKTETKQYQRFLYQMITWCAPLILKAHGGHRKHLSPQLLARIL